jgi:SNF2 family DNA or RNA helicase
MYDEGISPVVFVNYTETVEAINKKLSKKNKFNNKIAYIVGGQTNKQRDNDIADFQNNVKRIMIVNTQAGNAGISLHDLNGNFPRHTIISPTWSAVNMLQCLGRAHRAGGKTPVIQNILFAEDTIESQICKRVQTKINNLDALNDGDLTSGIRVI